MSEKTLAELKVQYEQDKANGTWPEPKPLTLEERQASLEYKRKQRNSPQALEAQAQRRWMRKY